MNKGIIGNNLTGTYGIFSSSTNTTIKNCLISNFSEAIRYSGATNGQIYNNTLTTTFDGGNSIRITSNSHNNNITQNTINNGNATGINIDGGQNTTIDCNGQNIIGGNYTGKRGIISTQYNTTIRNCNISNFALGIYFSSTSYGSIENTNVSTTHAYANPNGVGIYIDNMNNHQIINSQANSSRGLGIYLISSNNEIISNTKGISEAIYGIRLYSSNKNTITNSEGTSTTSTGIHMTLSSNNTITNTTITSNSSTATILSTNSTNNTFTNNTLKSGNQNTALIKIDITAGNNLFYWNNFTATSGLWINNSNSTNMFNTSGGTGAQGNYYDGIESYEIFDSNADGWGDTGSQYPINNETIPTKWIGFGADYGPATSRTALTCGNLETAGVTYNLSANIAINGTTCFNITAENVTLDCNGYSISGNNTFGTSGVYTNQFNTTIRNCVISGFDTGIYFFDNDAWDFYGAGDSGLIENNNVTATVDNVADPAYASAIFISAYANNNILNNNTMHSTYGFGIYFASGFNTTLANSVVYGGAAGIRSYGSDNCLIINSTGSSELYEGISLQSISNFTIMNSTGISSSYSASYYGFSLYSGSQHNTIINSTFISNSNTALKIYDDSHDNNIINCQISGNISDGALVIAANSTNNTIANNSINGNAAAYTVMLQNSTFNIFINNTIMNAATLVYLDENASNNMFYWNNFSDGTYWVNNSNSTNMFNTTVGGVAQGNYYPDIATYEVYDSNNDGWGDIGSQYPFSEATLTKAKWDGYGADYGPYTAKSAYINITFYDPTPATGINTSNKTVIINATISTALALDDFTWNWNGVNHSLYDNDLVLMMNFDNVSSIGDNATRFIDMSRYGSEGYCIPPNNCPNYTSSGKYGAALMFDGIDDYVTVPNTTLKFNFTNGFTVSLWLKTVDIGNSPIGRWQNGFGIYYDNNWYAYNTGWVNTGAGMLADDEWHQYALTWNMTHLTSYRDGLLFDSDPVTGLVFDNISLRIGGDNRGTDFFNGTIDEVRIYNRSLSSANMSMLFKSNLNKYSSTDWQFYSNYSGLSLGTYTFQAFAGNTQKSEQSEQRTITITDLQACQNITLTGTTLRLIQNISINGSTCINISANDVEVDCAGFGISGNNTRYTFGVYTNATNVTVKNCVIKEFNVGIYYHDAERGLILNNSVNTTVNDVTYPTLGSAILLSNAAQYNNIINNTAISKYGPALFLYSQCHYNNISNLTGKSLSTSTAVAFTSSNNNRMTDSMIMGQSSLYGTLSFYANSRFNVIENNTINGLNGAYAVGFMNGFGGYNNLTNNMIMNATTLLYLDDNASNNTFYRNNFTNGTYWVNNSNSTNMFNISVGGVAQGNYYEGIASYNIYDGNNDGWGDSGEDYPLSNETASSRWFGFGVDYGPATSRSPPGCQNITVLGATVILYANVSINESTCMNVSAGNVTIDCQGYSISGNNTFNTFGVYTNQFNTTIRNCAIKGFDVGIYYHGADNGTIENNTINITVNNYNDPTYSAGILLYNGASYNRLFNNTVYSMYGPVFFLYSNSNNNIVMNFTGTSGSVQSTGGSAGSTSSSFNTYSNLNINGKAGYGAFVLYWNSNNNTIANSTINGLGASRALTLILGASKGNVFVNNKIFNATTLLYIWENASNNLFYWNNFTNGSVWVNNTNRTNMFNTTNSTGTPQGNYYEGIASYEVYDGNGDGWGDSGIQYPFSEATLTKAKWDGFGADYGPATSRTPAGCQNVTDSNTILTLINDLYINESTCFNITANNVTIDCAGYWIVGNNSNNSFGTYGVLSTGYNTTVKNCVIQNFSEGVRYSGARAGTIYNNSITTNLYGGNGIRLTANAHNNNVSHNSITSGNATGIWIDGGRNISVDCNGMNIVGGNYTSTYGVYSTQINTTVRNCNISNFVRGIFFNSAKNGLIENSNVYVTSTGPAIRIYNTANYNTITNTTAYSENEAGLSLYVNANYNNVTNSIFTSSRSSGTDIYYVNNNLLYNCTSTSYSDIGLFIGLDSSNNTVSNSRINGKESSYGALTIYSDSEENMVANSTINGNGGIYAINIRTGHNTGNIFINNTILNATVLLRLDENASYNSFYWNNFTNGTYWINNSNETNMFNTSGGTGAQGNYYEGIASYEVYDSDGNGWGDTGSQYPFSEATLTKAKWDGYGADFGPATSRTAAGCQNITTENTSIMLGQNLYINESTCFNVWAHNVTIDCAGYNIIGNNSPSTYGIFSNRSNTTVKNCNVSGFFIEIYFYKAQQGTVKDTTAYKSTDDNSEAILFSYTTNSLLDNVTANSSISSNSAGIGLVASNNSRIINSKGFAFEDKGIYVSYNSNNNVIANVTAIGEADVSLVIGGSNNNVTNVSSSGWMGGQISAGENNTIRDSMFNGAFVITGGSKNNIVVNSTLDGYYDSYAIDALYIGDGINTGNVFINNTISNATNLLTLGENSSYNLFYWNNFSDMGRFIGIGEWSVWINNSNETNMFNTSVGGVAQGNYYEGIASYNIYDGNNDGWGDTGSAYPLSNETAPTKWGGFGADFGPATSRTHVIPNVTLLIPTDHNLTVHDRYTYMQWNVSNPDGELLNYTIIINSSSIDPACPSYDYTVSDALNYTLPVPLCVNTEGGGGTYYNWTVRACDVSNCSSWATTFNFSIEPYVDINLTTKAIDFGTFNLGGVQNTSSGTPSPFVMQNDGNVLADLVNITVNQSLWSSVPLGTRYFQAKANLTSEGISFDTGASMMDWFNLSSSNDSVIRQLDWINANDSAAVDINVEVPMTEPAGNKTAYLLFSWVQTP